MEDSEGCVSDFFHKRSKIYHPLESNNEKSIDSSESFVESSCLSQLTLKEHERLEILPFFNITPRRMPQSPHYVFEEEFSSNPWALLVATIFLTKTSGKTARPIMKRFFERYPTPYHVLEDCPDSLEEYFYRLGLRKRGYMIWKLTYQFLSSKWRRASDLCGIGKYGEDAYRIFCLGHTDLEPGDRYLRLYLDWLRVHTDFLEKHSIIGCECVDEDPVLKYYRVTLRDAV